MLGLGTGAQRQYKVYWIRSGYRPLPAGDGAPPEAPPEGPAPEAFFYAIWLHLSIKMSDFGLSDKGTVAGKTHFLFCS